MGVFVVLVLCGTWLLVHGDDYIEFGYQTADGQFHYGEPSRNYDSFVEGEL